MMRKTIVLIALLLVAVSAQDMIVRVYAPSWHALKKISDKSLDIAAGRYGEWYDLVVDHDGLSQVIASGFAYDVIVPSLERKKEQVRGSYCSYDAMTDSLRGMETAYPSICKLDSLPNPTYLGRWIYGVKISDNVHVEEEDEPKFSIDGAHHSREWATPQAVLFFADSMLESYGVVSEITEIINTTEIYCWPVINVDGYDYDYPGQNMWRKNREPFGGSIGTDPNRNYGGACNGEIDGYWGAADEGQCSHYPSGETFPGAFQFSGDEIWAYTTFIREHGITTGFSLHSYGEQVMWAWGYKGAGTPDATLFNSKGTYMAGMMQRLSGGTYTPGQSYTNPYPTCGNTRDWVYGYSKWVAGRSALFYGAEIGTSFYQPAGDLDFISLQVFKGAKYLAGFADSLVLVAEGFVPPPSMYPLGTVGADFTVGWHAKNTFDNHPTQWQLVELSNPTVITDDLESGTERWILEGFTLSTAQAHSGTHSFFSGSGHNLNHGVRTAHPYLVESGDSLTFWCWYDLETNYDVTVVEVSENNLEWFCADTMRYSSSSGGWIRRALSLEDWVGKSVYFRFRMMSDGSVFDVGFYVDDVSPTCLFANLDTISSSITDTLYQFTGHGIGTYYYYTRGYNTAYGWGEYSCLEKVDVVVGVAEFQDPILEQHGLNLSLDPNPFDVQTRITCNVGTNVDQVLLRIFDSSGRVIKTFSLSASRSQLPFVIWDGTDMAGHKVAAGVYFIRLENDKFERTEKAILLR
jgi:hypothetical protein